MVVYENNQQDSSGKLLIFSNDYQPKCHQVQAQMHAIEKKL